MAQPCAWEQCVRVCVIPSWHPGVRVWSLGVCGAESQFYDGGVLASSRSD